MNGMSSVLGFLSPASLVDAGLNIRRLLAVPQVFKTVLHLTQPAIDPFRIHEAQRLIALTATP
jgi:hypothetical protein